MTQTAEPALPDPKTMEVIRCTKDTIKGFAEYIRELKRCRKTKHPAPDELMEKHQCGSPQVAARKAKNLRNLVTAHLIVYGELRGKPHPVRDPDRWKTAVERIKGGHELFKKKLDNMPS